MHPSGFEPLAFAFGGQRSIQLSYGCVIWGLTKLAPLCQPLLAHSPSTRRNRRETAQGAGSAEAGLRGGGHHRDTITGAQADMVWRECKLPRGRQTGTGCGQMTVKTLALLGGKADHIITQHLRARHLIQRQALHIGWCNRRHGRSRLWRASRHSR